MGPDSSSPFSNPDPKSPPRPLAIVGIGCRLPGGLHDVSSVWDFLKREQSAITEVPADRWNAERFYSPEAAAQDKMITKWGGFVDHFDEFDAAFFGITPREALRLDPQQRWLLENSWEALEDGRRPPGSLRNSPTGVFVGISGNDYGKLQVDYPERVDLHTNIGNTSSIAANRISYCFDLKGPSLSVDTACSSAMVAIHLACQSLWSGECEAALAGGVNALLLPDGSIGFSKASMLSPSGQCFAFDSRADGYVRSEGSGMIFLRPLSAALRDGDPIRAVIRSSVVNQDGKTSSMPVPGLESQKTMLREALERAGVPPERVAYVEAHGTGTPVGDPIEARALGAVLSENRAAGEACPIGSIKTNLGHLECASGIAGLIKAVLVLEHREIPPNLNFATPNPDIPFDELRLKVAAEPQALPAPNGAPPVVLVNSFGFGGTNGCLVLEAAPEGTRARINPGASRPSRRPLLLPLSARGAEALRSVAGQMRDSLDGKIADTCLVAALQKEHHDDRLVVVGESGEALRTALDRWIQKEAAGESVVTGRRIHDQARPAFVFTGQGAQWWAMGRQLLEREPVFRETIETIDAELGELASWSLLEEMTRPESSSKIDRTEIAQPAIFALQTGLVALWKSWGVEPSRVVGHSVGEVAAAHCAGIFSLGDACRLIFHRSRLQATTGGNGGMVAIGLSPDEAKERLEDLAGSVALAVINSPNLVTLAGDREPLESLAAALEAEGIFVRRLPIGYAFHTRRMDPIREELLNSLADLSPRSAAIPMVSTVTAGEISGEDLDARYWWRNVRRPVRFGPAVEKMIEAGETLFLEVGPHPALRTSVEACFAGLRTRGTVRHSLKREADESEEMLRNLAALHAVGAAVDWRAVIPEADESAPVRLPSYPWQRERFWLESNRDRHERLDPFDHPLLGQRIAAPNPTWEIPLDPRSFPYLDDHKFWDRIVFPVAGFAEIGLAVARRLFPDDGWVLEDLEVHQILFLSKEVVSRLRVECDEGPDHQVRVYSLYPDSETWTLHVSARIAPKIAEPEEPLDLRAIRGSLDRHFAHWDYYEDLKAAGYPFGGTFRQVEQVWCRPGESLAQIVVPEALRDSLGDYHLHPACLDACFQAIRGALIGLGDSEARQFFLPGAIGSLRLFAERLPERFWVHAKVPGVNETNRLTQLRLCDKTGNHLASILGFRLDLSPETASTPDQENFFYHLEWDPCPLPEAGPDGGEKRTTFLVLADQGGISDRLIGELERRGHRTIRLEAVNPDHLSQVTESLDGENADRVVVAHCGCLDHPAEDELTSESLARAQQSGVLSALDLAQALLEHDTFQATMPRVTFFTRGAREENREPVSRLASAPLTGFLRVANSEHPGFQWTQIELEGDPGAEAMADELLSGDPESEVSYRDGVRFARRLRRVTSEELPRKTTRMAAADDPDKVPFRLELNRPGKLDRLMLNASARRDPAADEIEVRVHATGLNFRDLMKALAIYPGEPEELRQLGDDFSGTVVRVGKTIEHLRPGDEVSGVAVHAFQSFVVTSPAQVFRKPAPISHAEAATLPTVFLTAHYCLHHLARMQPGESILIHAGTGGVGQAAIQIAESLGLRIFATAGSPEKRQWLRDRGIDGVMDSRTLAFADEIKALTGGRGVDAVLNSLSGEFIVKSLSVLAPYGRFLEIGKVDLHANRKIAMKALKDNIAYFIVDMAQFFEKRPEAATGLIAELQERFEKGDYRPLPRTVFPVSDATDAFRLMAEGGHQGKIVLDFEKGPFPVGPATEEGKFFRGDATYLISGGTDGFGLEIAKWLAGQGARNLALLSRRGPKTEEAAAGMKALRDQGIRILESRTDVCDPEAVRQVLETIDADLPELAGVFHGAMVVADGMIADLSREEFLTALDPKMHGAWNLHEATRDRPLEYFVCISSFTGVVGGLRQSNYGAGNVFLDELAHYRHARGLPALSINWGPLVGAGFIERNQNSKNYMEAVGATPFDMAEAMGVLEKLLRIDHPQIMASKVDWQSTHRIAPAATNLNLYSEVREQFEAGELAGSIRPLILAAPPARQRELIETFLAGQIAAVFGAGAETIDLDTPVTQLGLDSLMSIELVNRLEDSLGIPFPLGSILNGPTIRELSGRVQETLVASAEGEPSAELSAVEEES